MCDCAAEKIRPKSVVSSRERKAALRRLGVTADASQRVRYTSITSTNKGGMSASDAIGIVHENGLIPEELAAPDSRETRPAVAQIAQKYHESVRVLNTVISQEQYVGGARPLLQWTREI